jgi:neutral ceramidase
VGGAVLVALALVLNAAPAAADEYLLGRASADITGPLLGVQLWGFGRPDQVGDGLHIRLRARAFVIAERADPDSRLAFVSVDLGSVDHHVTLSVLDALRDRLGPVYSLDNVIISATHTHAGPGGYWHSRTDTGLDGGLYPAHFDAIVAGITDAVVAAHHDLKPGRILVNTGTVADAGANRSRVAYLENPAQERARYDSDTNRDMLLLRFEQEAGPAGMLNWYALHPTAMNYYNTLVSGDHKGYASWQVEQERGVTYRADGEFVAAFAQSDPGDVTPNTNLDNTGPGATDVDTTQIMGQRQVAVAQQLFDSATEALRGPIETRQRYVDLGHYPVDAAFTGDGARITCPSAYGYSFAGGSTEDGGAHFLFREGMLRQSRLLDWLIRFVTGAPRWTAAVSECQSPKPILFETGTGDPPLQSQIRSFTLARIGQLVIVAVPAEMTTMAGRRLRDTVREHLGDWVQHVVIAGYANGFAGYVTTPQEYMLQQYEAAHTLHGKWSLPAYRQIVARMARALDGGAAVVSEVMYDDWRGKTAGMPLPMGEGIALPADVIPGQVIAQPNAQPVPGEAVSAEFVSVHPNERFLPGFNYLRVERRENARWALVANDSDWSTRVRWRPQSDYFVARVSWEVPPDGPPGTYRLVHRALDRAGTVVLGVSQPFTVR